MKIERIELRKIFLPYKEPFRTSGWIEDGNYGIIAKIYSGGLEGWGESPVGLEPWYNEETTETAWSIQKIILAPMLFRGNISGPSDTDSLFKSVRGNKIAKNALEFAVWDLWGKVKGISISKLLGRQQEEGSGWC